MGDESGHHRQVSLRYTPEVREQIVSMVYAGMRAKGIASVLGTSEQKLRVRCCQLNIPLRVPDGKQIIGLHLVLDLRTHKLIARMSRETGIPLPQIISELVDMAVQNTEDADAEEFA
jgi:hypothetical protein